MANMLIPSIVLLMSLVVVHCASPTCTPTACTTGTCKWTCEKTDGTQIASVTDADCNAEDDDCGTGGKCKPKCEPAPVDPTCSPVCGKDKDCTWSCKDGGTAISGGYVGACIAVDGACGSGTTSGKCKSECVAKSGSNQADKTTAASSKTADNGSVKLGLSTFVLVFGVLARMFLQY